MASNIVRRRWFGWAHKGVAALYATKAAVGGATVVLTYDEPLRAAPAAAQFTATVAAVARVVSGVVVSGSKLTVTLAAPNLTAGQAVVITYAAGGTPALRLADTDGNEVANFASTVTAA